MLKRKSHMQRQRTNDRFRKNTCNAAGRYQLSAMQTTDNSYNIQRAPAKPTNKQKRYSNHQKNGHGYEQASHRRANPMTRQVYKKII